MLVVANNNWVDEGVSHDGVVLHAATAVPDSVSLLSKYDGITVPNVSLTFFDEDKTGLTLSASSAYVSEKGDAVLYSVVLDSQPRANVVVRLSSSYTESEPTT